MNYFIGFCLMITGGWTLILLFIIKWINTDFDTAADTLAEFVGKMLD